MTSISPTGANNTNASTSTPQTIAVIGGGPGAMSFCHALELQKKELKSKGEDVSSFPIVRCFERSAGPGGVWRSDRSHEEEGMSTPRSPSPATVASYGEEKKDDDSRNGAWRESPKSKLRKLEDGQRSQTTAETSEHDKTNMYSALWTNGPKEQFEMHDYTFKDHFGNVEIPTFLPRKYVLEYLLARVTRNCPDFFERYFSFRTSVENVQFIGDEDASSESDENETIITNKFRVCTLDETTGIERVEFFDKCVWAAGLNGFPSIPRKTWKKFTKGGFTGRMVHSSDTSTFKEDVEGKNVLMIGGGYSSEDLALMAIKEGASRIHITSRYSDSEVHSVSRWPYDKVDVHAEKQISSVSGNEITLSGVYYCAKKGDYVKDDEVEKVTISNIDTVIFCTGYSPNLQMLDQALQDPLPDYEDVTIPADWVMKDNTFSQKILGDTYKTIMPDNYEVCPSDEYYFSDNLYATAFCIDNPNMMYIQEYGDGPLASIDIFAWMLAKVVSNQIALPSEEEMRAEEQKILLEHMNNPTVRYIMDWKYQKAIDDAVESDENPNLVEVMEDEWEESRDDFSILQQRILGRIMNKYEYPVSFLSPDGKTLSKYQHAIKKVWDIGHRDLAELTEEDNAGGWRTFRDFPETGKCTSYFTGLASRSLPKPWSEIDENEKLW